MARTLRPDQVEAIAAEHEALRAAVQLGEPVTRRFPDMTLDDAYAIQAAWVELQVADGAVVRGHKVGLTSRAMQLAMRIDEPDFGTLLDYMFVDDGSTLRAVDYNDPKLEVELAFVLGRDLDAGDVTTGDVLAATEAIVPAVELIDARTHRIHPVDGRPRTVRDTIADNAANAGIITGGRAIDPADVVAGKVDLRWVPGVLQRNGTVEETGVAAGVLGDPVLGVVWLANRLHGLGVALEAGETVLAGSFTRPVGCRPGDRFAIDFGPHGQITVDFE